MSYFKHAELRDVDGKTIASVEGLEYGSEEVRFRFTDGSVYKLHHEQDCCEDVRLDDPGDLTASELAGATLHTIQERVDSGGDAGYGDSCTWTFYVLVTSAGRSTLRWYGTSNGYYSEAVDFECVVPPSVSKDS